jgi:hypothetical protein
MRLTPSMEQLQKDPIALRMNRVHDILSAGDLFVSIDALRNRTFSLIFRAISV